VKLAEARRRLPVVTSLPTPAGRRGDTLAERAAAAGPTWVVWELTLACDQKCAHCGPRAGRRREGELTTEEALRLVEELRGLGVREVVLIGGEAYLRGDFVLVVRAIRAAGMVCTLTTGGLNLDDERVEAMIAAGVSSVTVSIDGLEPTHDALRGVPGSWRRAFAALRRVKAAGGQIACNTQVNQRTRGELLALLEPLAEVGVHSWQLQMTVPHGNAADQDELVLQPYMLVELFATLEQVLLRCQERGIRLWPANNLGYFGPLERRLRAAQGGHFRGCTAGITTMGIDSDGGIKTCPSLGGPLHVGGRWPARSVREIWDESYQLGYVRRRTLDDLWGFCRDCYYASTCMAGCTAASEPLLGRPGNNPFCHHRALALDAEGLRERIERVQRAPGLPFDHGLWRVIVEPKDPELRARVGAVRVEAPRTTRAEAPTGPGRAIEVG
jgi:radical SAM protein with 4Fe4S-binding SPASM domain